MNESEAHRAIERRMDRRLQRWAEFRQNPKYPAAVTSSVFSGEVPARGGMPTSPQERWMMKHDRDIRNAVAIEEGFRWLAQRGRRLIFMRHVQLMSWQDIGRRLGITRQRLRQERQTAYSTLSEQFGEPLELFLDRESA